MVMVKPNKVEDAYKPAISLAVIAGVCITIAIQFAAWPFYGLALFSSLTAIIIMLEKVALSSGSSSDE
jgi:hypothetical protein